MAAHVHQDHQAADHRGKVGEKLFQDHIDLRRLSARHGVWTGGLDSVDTRDVPSEPREQQGSMTIQDISVPRMWLSIAQNGAKCVKMLKGHPFNMQKDALQR